MATEIVLPQDLTVVNRYVLSTRLSALKVLDDIENRWQRPFRVALLYIFPAEASFKDLASAWMLEPCLSASRPVFMSFSREDLDRAQQRPQARAV